MSHRNMSIRSIAVIAAAAVWPGAGAAETLAVELKKVRSASGEIQIDVYGLDRRRAAGKRVSARPGGFMVEFSDLRPGAYVVYVYHDENGNGKLDTGGLLGLPIEGYAFSNDAPIRMGPPSIAAMKVIVPPRGRVSTPATIRYRR